MTDEMCAVHNQPYKMRRGMANGLLALHCSWDGSLHPDKFMELIESGATLGPTDKNYKVYVELEDDTHAEELRIIGMSNHTKSGEGWIQVKDADLSNVDISGWSKLDLEEWILLGKRGSNITDKFYFEHLSEEQKHHFVYLLNDKKLSIGLPGRFYVLPFFVK